jgi:hypothetical protein
VIGAGTRGAEKKSATASGSEDGPQMTLIAQMGLKQTARSALPAI